MRLTRNFSQQDCHVVQQNLALLSTDVLVRRPPLSPMPFYQHRRSDVGVAALQAPMTLLGQISLNPSTAKGNQ